MDCLNLCGTECSLDAFFDINRQIVNPCGELIVGLTVTFLICIKCVYLISKYYNQANRCQNIGARKYSVICIFILQTLTFITLTVELALLFTVASSISYPRAHHMLISSQILCCTVIVFLTLKQTYVTKLKSCALVTFCSFCTYALQAYDAYQKDKHNIAVSFIFFCNFILSALCILNFLVYFTIACQNTSQRVSHLTDEEDSVLLPVLQKGHQDASCLSQFLFCWTNCLTFEGSLGKLNSIEQLYDLPDSLNTSRLSEWLNAELKNPRSNYSLFKSLNSCFGLEFYSLGVLKFLSDVLGFAGPLVLEYIVNSMESSVADVSHRSFNKLYVCGAILFASTVISSMLTLHFTFKTSYIGQQIRGSLIPVVYNKVMRVQQARLSCRYSAGELTNFISVDSDRIVNFVSSFHDFWSLPLKICIALFLLYREIHLAFLAGIGFVVILIPINRWLAKKIGDLSVRMLSSKDSRLRCIAEMLSGIRVVKFCAWENFFRSRINYFRREELRSLKSRKFLDALCVYFWASAPAMVAILTFSTYILMGNELTVAKVFTSLSLFNILIDPLNSFPWVIGGIVEAWISLKRLQLFFNESDFIEDDLYSNSYCAHHNHCAICVRPTDFFWSSESLINCAVDSNWMLRRIELDVKKASLIGLIGPVGSGKSSLLVALMGELINREPRPSIYFPSFLEGIAFVSQEAWLRRGTVRNNILFGSSYDEAWYNQVVDACALTTDFRAMPQKDLTYVGEQGVMLSGGQKTRIALARAVYQNLPVYLLDDPLSAVDALVARHLFEKCIRGILKTKTVLLVTHHIRFLREADQILLLDNGSIHLWGKPDQILPKFSAIDKVASSALFGSSSFENYLDSSGNNESTSEQPSDHSDNMASCEPLLIAEEEREIGFVKPQVYLAYISAIGTALTILIALSLGLMQVSKNVCDWWLSHWLADNTLSNFSNSTDSTYKSLFSHVVTRSVPLYETRLPASLFFSDGLSYIRSVQESSTFESFNDEKYSIFQGVPLQGPIYYLIIYAVLIAMNTFFTLARSFSYAQGGIKAAEHLHDRLLNQMLKAPCGFFDKTPIGRLINRFSYDVFSVDDSLPFQANRLVMYLLAIIGTLVMTCYGLPWFTVCIVPIAILYYRIQNYYRKTTCELTRLNKTSLSPILGHFSDTISGIVTIRAFKRQKRFTNQLYDLLDVNQRAQYANLACKLWLSVRLQFIGVFMITSVVLLALVQHQYQTVNAGLVGLAISYALSITSILSGLLQSFTETEKEMVAVERISGYIENLPEEENMTFVQQTIPDAWPISGRIEFSHVFLQYAPDSPFALSDVCFVINPGEKIGIVGRTGSGKSSLLQAIFRTVPLNSGRIMIDDIDTAVLKLGDLRSRLSIIPQTPFLFSGTLRENLLVDLDISHSESSAELDRRINLAIKTCGLTRLVEKFGDGRGLDESIGERGGALSVGERQLVCLARALLIGAKILCIDEATANVDHETDAQIQKTLRICFPNCTVLTIAHRVDTIMDYDRVLVMDNGRAVEFDTPQNLLSNRFSHFCGLARI